MTDTQIVQTRCEFHETIATVRPRIAKRILDTPGPFDTREGMLDSHPNPRQGAIVSLVARRQCFALGLFFG